MVTKTDTLSESDLEELSKELPSDYLYMSAVTGKGTEVFLREIEQILDEQRGQTETD